MNESLLPSRYAKAFYKFAVEKKIDEPVYKAMLNIIGAFESQEGQALSQTIANPFISRDDKRRLVMNVSGIDKPDSPQGKALNDFLSLLFKNNRISELRGIVYAYADIYRREHHISRVHVTWAAQPEAEAEKRLVNMIEQRLGDGSMEYSSSIDPDLIGGFKVAIDNEQLDASVQNELRQLRQLILSK